MPDWVKKTTARADAAAPGEALHAALFCRPLADDGSVKRLGAMNAEGAADGEGLAARLPRINTVLALTDEHLLAFGHGSLLGRVKGVLARWELAEVANVDLDGDPGAGGTTLVIHFADGTSVRVVPGSRARRFVEAFGEHQPVP
jgi:hypothetical protein